MPKVIYCVDLTHSGTITNADTFPLGIGSIAAMAKKEFGDTLDFELFKFPKDLNDALRRRIPDVICFSNYSWNLHLSLSFAEFVRSTSPSTVIVMGGPNISITTEGRHDFLKRFPVIDFYVKYEGEITFCNLLRELFACDFNSSQLKHRRLRIENMLYSISGTLIEGSDNRITDLSHLPSPYTSGILDKFFSQGLRPLVEFSRGCPYSCTFCTDFHQLRNKVVRRSLGYVRAEVEYIASRIRSASDLIIADLNFGMFKEDIEVARIIRSVIDKFEWPKSITGSPGKSQPERVAEVVSIINGKDHGILKFAASMQSTDTDVLKLIKRQNLPIDRVSPLLGSGDYESDYREYFTELIIGLPGETKEKHYQSLRDVIDCLGMNVVNVHQLSLLQGAPMALPSQRQRFAFDVRYRILVGCIGNYQIGDRIKSIAEIEEVVVANSTLSFEEWLDCRVMHLLVKIYIDRDYFVEIFGLIRRLELSPLDLLERLSSDVIPTYPGLSRLFDRFRRKSKEPLHSSFEELTLLANRSEFIEKHANGRLGGNEMLVHRAMAYLDHNDELHDALRDATILYLKETDHLDKFAEEYVSEAVHFSKLRKFNPDNYRRVLSGHFSFDFINAKRNAFRVLPEEVKIEISKINFYFNDIAKSEIDYAIRTWVYREGTEREIREAPASAGGLTELFSKDATTRFNFGKFFHYSNLRVMSRSVEYASNEVGRRVRCYSQIKNTRKSEPAPLSSVIE